MHTFLFLYTLQIQRKGKMFLVEISLTVNTKGGILSDYIHVKCEISLIIETYKLVFIFSSADPDKS